MPIYGGKPSIMSTSYNNSIAVAPTWRGDPANKNVFVGLFHIFWIFIRYSGGERNQDLMLDFYFKNL